jgi:hypothetical protein
MRFRCLPLCVSLLLPVLSAAAESSPLASSPSEFVRAQAGSAVHWHTWSDATLAEARASGKSIYVFIGSPLSELARATISQTFTSAKTVEWLNQNFFCIFVDGDARPDLAAYGQHYIRSVKQLQGVPVHLWLTSDLQIYDGANYLPPSEEWGKPGFLKAARSALDSWTAGPDRARAFAKEALGLMRVLPLAADAPVDATARLEVAAKSWIAAIDPVNGGFGSAPKQPEPEVIRFLLARGDAASREAALNAARALVKGAAHDPVDGGFYRRCIDEAWKEPYYQKTLADQARIALALFEAADAGKDEALRAAAIGALDFALKVLRNPDGSFAAALDGTMEENADPAKLPVFVRVGTARAGARALLVTALQRSGDKRLTKEAKVVKAGLRPETAADYLAVALAGRSLGDKSADGLIGEAGKLYFDPATGAYQASPKELPPGIAVRVPASGDTPSAEVLALLAGVDAQSSTQIRRALLSNIEYDDQPPGDVLLGLSQRK